MLGIKRRTIGVFISQMNHKFLDNLNQVIITKVKDLDYNVAFFTNIEGYGQTAYETMRQRTQIFLSPKSWMVALPPGYFGVVEAGSTL